MIDQLELHVRDVERSRGLPAAPLTPLGDRAISDAEAACRAAQPTA